MVAIHLNPKLTIYCKNCIMVIIISLIFNTHNMRDNKAQTGKSQGVVRRNYRKGDKETILFYDPIRCNVSVFNRVDL